MKKLIWLAFLLPLTAFANPFTNEFCLDPDGGLEDDLCVGFNLDRDRMDVLQAQNDALQAQSDALQAQTDSLQAQIDALETGGGGGPFTVDCTAGETVQAAVDLAKQGDVIHISGVCTGNVLIVTDGITLDGGGLAEIHGVTVGVPAFTGAITVSGATNVTIRSFAMITGASIGVNVIGSGHAFIGGQTVGEGNTISDNADIGVSVFQSSSGIIQNNIISNNGIPITNGASGGINVNANSSAFITSNTITGAGQNGILVFSSSEAFLLDNLISGSQLFGVSVIGSSNLRMFESALTPGLGPNQIINNQAFGILCQIGGSIFMFQDVAGPPDALVTASGNPAGDLMHSSSCAVFPGNTGTVFALNPFLP